MRVEDLVVVSARAGARREVIPPVGLLEVIQLFDVGRNPARLQVLEDDPQHLRCAQAGFLRLVNCFRMKRTTAPKSHNQHFQPGKCRWRTFISSW